MILGSQPRMSMSHIAWQAAVKTSTLFESRRISWIRSASATASCSARKRRESACQVISSARSLLPGPSGSSRAMSIQFLKMSRPLAPSFAAAQLITTDRVRSGYLLAKTIAIIAAHRGPWTCARIDAERVEQPGDVVGPDLHVVALATASG